MLVTVNNRLKFEIEIVHDLSCHPVLAAYHFVSTLKQLVLSNQPYLTSNASISPNFHDYPD